MSDEAPYVNEDGWSVDCTMVLPGKGAAVWSLVIQMDPERDQKSSQIFYSPNSTDNDSTEAFQTDTWISAFWVSPSDTVYACDGFQLWSGQRGGEFTPQSGLSDRMILRPWGLGEHDRFILGDNGLVLRSDGQQWRDISLSDGRRLVDIDGRSPETIYAVGHRGAFCRLQGDIWEPIDLGTDANIRALHVEHDGSVYACGERGIAFRYSHGEVEFFKAPPDRYFGGVTSYMGHIYFGATGEGVDRLEGTDVVSFKSTIHGLRLSSNADLLWSCGGNTIFRYDGTGWIGEDFI